MPAPGCLRLAVVGLLALLVACVPAAPSEEEEEPGVTVGVGSTIEQSVLAALTAVALEAEGIQVDAVDDLGGTRELRLAAGNGDIDLFWDYTGAAWAIGLGQLAPTSATGESYERVRDEDARRNDFEWLAPTQANATLALFVRQGDLPADGTGNLTWLSARLSERRTLCADPDFVDRRGGLDSLAAEYPIDLAALTTIEVDEDEAVQAVADERCFAGLGTATSGEARDAGLVPVTDDLNLFPAFVVAPVVTQATLEAVPGVRAALEPVTSYLTTAELARLNAEVVAGEPPRVVAERALGVGPPDTPG